MNVVNQSRPPAVCTEICAISPSANRLGRFWSSIRSHDQSGFRFDRQNST
ncbi:hypothetical protein GHT06_016863 [Daphnia sinensis]|uniref:Uncharacterized protein n=1 Tax=Daphnia sinensis TaxID=1820382 RepID=A0AAD5L6G8_9CRUS|nr:hypothetical protein GHT06_016863 [Daphnia sinensis]